MHLFYVHLLNFIINAMVMEDDAWMNELKLSDEIWNFWIIVLSTDLDLIWQILCRILSS